MEEGLSHNKSAKGKNERIRDGEMGEMENSAEKGDSQK